MTDNEIIKALECCASIDNTACVDCPTHKEDYMCAVTVKRRAISLINRQKAEIERLEELLEGWKTEAYKVADEKDELYCNAVERVKAAKAEAIKEFAERLKEEMSFGRYIQPDQIDNLVKEMVGARE